MAKKKRTPGMVEQVKQAIRDSGQSLNAISKASGVDSGRLSRFMRGEREITITAFEKLCEFLGLQLARPTVAAATEESE